jgi:DNA-binding transcriptional regulator YhcF (GntR family)
MKAPHFFKIIHIDGFSATPKYLQLSNAILEAIHAGKLEKDDVLPSINELSFELEISRDTAEKSYKHLKGLGVLGSVPGKGYFVASDHFKQDLRVFLLFNKLSAHKKIVYDAFAEALGEKAAIDFYIYNNDYSLFKRLLDERKGDYSHYVIIPHFLEGGEHAHEVINTLPKEKLVLLDKMIPGITGAYAAAYESFEQDIYDALEAARERLSKYHTIKLIFPRPSYYPREIVQGFERFCQEYAFTNKLVDDIEAEPMERGEVYITVMEDDLVKLIERILGLGWQVGKDVGVISYNETPLKKIILNGITTISTDFYEMGRIAARLVLEGGHRHQTVPFKLTLRASL